MGRFAAGVMEAAEAGNLLSSRPELAMLDQLTQAQLRRLAEADCPEWRKRIDKGLGDVEVAIESGDVAKIGLAAAKLRTLVDDGGKMDRIIKDLVELIDRRSNRAQREREVDLKAADVVTRQELAELLGGVVKMLQEELDDTAKLRVFPRLRHLAGGLPETG